eukprot:362822-Chlamydomonas_euryale.AAC.24
MGLTSHSSLDACELNQVSHHAPVKKGTDCYVFHKPPQTPIAGQSGYLQVHTTPSWDAYACPLPQRHWCQCPQPHCQSYGLTLRPPGSLPALILPDLPHAFLFSAIAMQLSTGSLLLSLHFIVFRQEHRDGQWDQGCQNQGCCLTSLRQGPVASMATHGRW